MKQTIILGNRPQMPMYTGFAVIETLTLTLTQALTQSLTFANFILTR